jgi:hypothetical protein
MLVNAEQRAAQEPHDVAERAGVLVEHRIGAEQPPIPGPTPVKIGDRHSDMGNRGKLSHHAPNSFGPYSTRRVAAVLGHSRFCHTGGTADRPVLGQTGRGSARDRARAGPRVAGQEPDDDALQLPPLGASAQVSA